MTLQRVTGMLLIGMAVVSVVACGRLGDTGEFRDAAMPRHQIAGTRPPILPDPIRGIYLTGWAAGTRLDETIDYIQKHDLNAIVIDIKDTDGRLSFAMPGTLADHLGANASKMGSLPEVQSALDYLREQGIYVIGRMALFQDDFLPLKRPDWALRTQAGEPWRDAAGGYWLDPTKREVLDYHVEIATFAAKLGFDEIQFDYIRYPSQQVAGYNDGPRDARIEAVTDFAAAARDRIQGEVDIPVSGAIFGIVAVSEADYNLGQSLVDLSEALDYVSPMFYPSHFLSGDFGLKHPNSEPYKTIFASTAAALSRTADRQWGQIRPWIQSFFDYEAPQVEEQVRALKDLGIDSFLVWNPRGRYRYGVDYSLADEGKGRLADSPFRSILYTLLSPAPGIFVPDSALKLPSHLDFVNHRSEYALNINATRQANGYRIELWQSASDKTSGDGAEMLLHIAMQKSARPITPDQDVSAADNSTAGPSSPPSVQQGAVLTWTDGGYEWYMWAPSMFNALAAKGSLQELPPDLF